MARFNRDRASALAEYAIFTLLMKAMEEKETYVIAVHRNTIRAAMKQQNLHEHHEEEIGELCMKHGIAWGYSGGTYYFFMPETVEVYDANHVLADLTEDYAKYSAAERQRRYEDNETYPLIDAADNELKRKPSGRKKK